MTDELILGLGIPIFIIYACGIGFVCAYLFAGKKYEPLYFPVVMILVTAPIWGLMIYEGNK